MKNTEELNADELEELWLTQKRAVNQDLSEEHEAANNSLQDDSQIIHDTATDHSSEDELQKDDAAEGNPEEGPGSDAGESSESGITHITKLIKGEKLKEISTKVLVDKKRQERSLINAFELLNKDHIPLAQLIPRRVRSRLRKASENPIVILEDDPSSLMPLHPPPTRTPFTRSKRKAAEIA
ncbi:hypothetical protein HAX54_009811 [Datura stramonium]|uniref:Uncharacterized protein n=1 Tax=Datura stramonium TaxID=4076 RepID=A0ABS8TF98_DATST|nr:hypothetical protein [Datura stramonium]